MSNDKKEDKAEAEKKFPQPKEILGMATRLVKDIKNSVCSIIEDYKSNQAAAKTKDAPKEETKAEPKAKEDTKEKAEKKPEKKAEKKPAKKAEKKADEE